MFANFELKEWDTESQLRLRNISDQRQVYGQITGEKAVLLQLESDAVFNMDAFAFYQASSAGMTGLGLSGKERNLSKIYLDLGSKLLDDSFQKERLLEHYNDQKLKALQQLYSAFGQARLLFPNDPLLADLIRNVEDLPEPSYQPPDKVEMLKQPDINAFLERRRKVADVELKRLYGEPIDDVLAHQTEG